MYSSFWSTKSMAPNFLQPPLPPPPFFSSSFPFPSGYIKINLRVSHNYRYHFLTGTISSPFLGGRGCGGVGEYGRLFLSMCLDCKDLGIICLNRVLVENYAHKDLHTIPVRLQSHWYRSSHQIAVPTIQKNGSQYNLCTWRKKNHIKAQSSQLYISNAVTTQHKQQTHVCLTQAICAINTDTT